MLKGKTFALMAVVAALLVGAMYMRQETPSTIQGSGDPMFVDLISKVNDAAEIRTQSAGEVFTIKSEEGRWVVAEKGGYPADEQNVRQLLVGAANLRRIEPKTSKPELYSELGVEPPDNEEAKSIAFEISDAGGQSLASLTLGNQRPGRSDPNIDEYYVRTADDPQVWLVEGKVPQAKTAQEWLKTEVLSLDASRVREVKVTHGDGEEILVAKEEPEQEAFALAGLAEDEELDGDWKVTDLGRALTELLLDDVKPDADVAFEDNTMNVEMTTFDGLRVTMIAADVDEVTFAKLSAEFDEKLVRVAQTDKEDDKDTEASEDTSGLLDVEAVKTEAQELAARWDGWAYAIPSYRMAYLTKKRDDLVKEKESAAAVPEPQPGQSPVGDDTDPLSPAVTPPAPPLMPAPAAPSN